MCSPFPATRSRRPTTHSSRRCHELFYFSILVVSRFDRFRRCMEFIRNQNFAVALFFAWRQVFGPCLSWLGFWSSVFKTVFDISRHFLRKVFHFSNWQILKQFLTSRRKKTWWGREYYLVSLKTWKLRCTEYRSYVMLEYFLKNDFMNIFWFSNIDFMNIF